MPGGGCTRQLYQLTSYLELIGAAMLSESCTFDFPTCNNVEGHLGVTGPWSAMRIENRCHETWVPAIVKWFHELRSLAWEISLGPIVMPIGGIDDQSPELCLF